MLEVIKFIPFLSHKDMIIHIEASTMLLDQIKSSIELWEKCEYEKKVEIEEHLTKSIQILNDGFVNMIKSIQQGYVR